VRGKEENHTKSVFIAPIVDVPKRGKSDVEGQIDKEVKKGGTRRKYSGESPLEVVHRKKSIAS